MRKAATSFASQSVVSFADWLEGVGSVIQGAMWRTAGAFRNALHLLAIAESRWRHFALSLASNLRHEDNPPSAELPCVSELGQLAAIDHAYVYRLESGEKESPSDDVIDKLVRALKLDRRDADILRFTAAHPKADPGLVAYALKEDRSITYEVFTMAAGAVYRAEKRPDYAKIVRRARRILEEESRENDGG